jgi:DNA-binding transcriptional MerR regulator
LGVSLPTLRKIEKEGKLVPFRTPGEHRRYTIEMLDEYLESTQRQPPESTTTME